MVKPKTSKFSLGFPRMQKPRLDRYAGTAKTIQWSQATKAIADGAAVYFLGEPVTVLSVEPKGQSAPELTIVRGGRTCKVQWSPIHFTLGSCPSPSKG